PSPLSTLSRTYQWLVIISPPPEPFSGNLEKSWGFLLQCTLVFHHAPHSFADNASKISYVIGLLRDKALRSQRKVSLPYGQQCIEGTSPVS
ncbi:hypothetical protein GOODEAATRI_031090, partial [Goodea atripinnis]